VMSTRQARKYQPTVVLVDGANKTRAADPAELVAAAAEA
jgi:aspartate 1-decarboxylase